MNPKLIPILERIIARDAILSPFKPERLPQSALAYVRQNYRMDSFLSDKEQDLVETLAPFADDIADSFRDGSGGDASVFHLFEDGSLWLKTNAYSSVWTDARDFAVEVILPRMELSRMDADLLRAIGMDEQIDSVRQDFFHAFARTLHRECGIPFHESRTHWNASTRQLGDGEREEAELGGLHSGNVEGGRFVEIFRQVIKPQTLTA
jgi:hypothetical protein